MEEATTGREALAAVARLDPDLIVLDWMLPDIEGIEVGRRLRERGHKNAILFLTAKDAVENKVEALRAGGDDYVTKPFSLAEVVARVQAILRRTASELPGDVLRYEDLVARREPPRGLPRRDAGPADRDRVRAPPLLPPQPEARAFEVADPPERLALRLQRERERRRDVRELPPPQARRRGPAADQDRSPGGLHAGGLNRARAAVASRAARARRPRACDRGPRRGERRDVLGAELVPGRSHRQRAGRDRARDRPAGARRRSADRAARHGGARLARSTGRRWSRPWPAPKLPGAGGALAEAARGDRAAEEHGPAHEAVSYFTVGSSGDGGRYRVRASIEDGASGMLVVATSLDDVDSTLHRLLLIEAFVTVARRRWDRGARALGRAARPAAARRDRGHGGGDRGRRPLSSRRARRGAHRGRSPRPVAQRHAQPDRDVVPRAGGVGAEAPTVRRGRVARAAHAARRGARLRRALRPRRGDPAGRPGAVDEGDQPRVRADERAGRRPAAARPSRRRTSARARARSSSTRSSARRSRPPRRSTRSGRSTFMRIPPSSSATASACGRSWTTSSRTSAHIRRPDSPVSVTLTRVNGTAEIAVTDAGPGLERGAPRARLRALLSRRCLARPGERGRRAGARDRRRRRRGARRHRLRELRAGTRRDVPHRAPPGGLGRRAGCLSAHRRFTACSQRWLRACCCHVLGRHRRKDGRNAKDSCQGGRGSECSRARRGRRRRHICGPR